MTTRAKPGRPAKLTPEQVAWARLCAAMRKCCPSAVDLARDMGVSYQAIADAVAGRTFKWLPHPRIRDE